MNANNCFGKNQEMRNTALSLATGYARSPYSHGNMGLNVYVMSPRNLVGPRGHNFLFLVRGSIKSFDMLHLSVCVGSMLYERSTDESISGKALQKQRQ